MDTNALIAFGLTVLLVLANGFFVAAEYAFVRIRKTQLDELAQQGSARARLSASVVDKLDQYISASQLGVTLCSLAIGWIGEPAVAALLAPVFTWLPAPFLEVISFALAFGVITYLHIVVGELAPKYLAIQRALALALWCAYPLHLCVVFAAFQEGPDHTVGIAHVKERVGVGKESRTRAREVMRKVPVMPETMRLDQALAEFRRQRVQLAIVLDEFGGTAGLVTLEDVIEQLVGEVHDEFDREAPAFKEEAPGTFVVDGLTSLEALRDRLAIELPDEPYDTVGGLVFVRLGRLAAVGDAIEIEGYRFQVTAVDGRRVAQVRVVRARPPRKAA